LPYQPLAEIKYSLSAADVHVVTMGDNMLGIIHPCKIYGAMSLGKPILFFGPHESHIGQLIRQHEVGWCLPHGDVPEAVAALRQIVSLPPEILQRMGSTARDVARRCFRKEVLCAAVCDIVSGVSRQVVPESAVTTVAQSTAPRPADTLAERATVN
jgi:hypothetical protein